MIGLVLGVPVEEIYNGTWGYNAFLSSAALGGFFIVVSIHTVFAAAVAAVFSTFLQYVFAPILATVYVNMFHIFNLFYFI